MAYCNKQHQMLLYFTTIKKLKNGVTVTNVLPLAGIDVTLDHSCRPMQVIPRPHSIDKSKEMYTSGPSFIFTVLSTKCLSV